MAARRCAAEFGEAVGETVGYQVRFEEAVGPRTRLRFVTEGVLVRRMLGDPELRGVDAVVLDEFHERHLETDLALALLKRLQGRRPELRIVVMSATLEAGPVARYLGGCATLRSEGRSFPLEVEYRGYGAGALEGQVAEALARVLEGSRAGHTLVFLPGAAEIRRAQRACEVFARKDGIAVLPLHGDLSPAEQDAAVGPSAGRKVILATNVAESSVTIDGVNAVIDSGLARVASYSAWTGLPTLEVRRISKASATQRAGRAGRTGPGRAVRLYPQEDFAQRAEQDVPEILRADLSGLCLTLRAMGMGHVRDLEWLDEPPVQAIEAAEALLDRLRVGTANAGELGRFPLPPRLARMLVEAAKRGVPEDGVAVAALLGGGGRYVATDLMAALDEPADARVLQQRGQLRRLLRGAKQVAHDEEALLLAVLTGFPDRVARLRAGKVVGLANGVSAELAGERSGYEFMVVLDAEDRKEKAMPLVRLTARVEPEWLLDLFPERVREEVLLEWNAGAERVESVSRLRYDELILEESRGGAADAEGAAAMLAGKALEVGIERFVDGEALGEMEARIAFAGLAGVEAAGVLRALCAGLRSFADLREAAKGLVGMLEDAAGSSLRALAPATIKLPSGRATKVHYEAGKTPWIASRLQDFFGMKETPRIGAERVPVVVHLLAPNHRAVQTTTDLAGFWERLYPQVRRELMRRYPRHAWPEKV